MTSRELLVEALRAYQSSFNEELKFKDQFLSLLQHERCFHRDFLPGHITGSAWIVDSKREHVLLTHHAKLNTWLQPGGHADGDDIVLNVALREAEEETGLTTFTLLHQSIFDIDIHLIPARKEFPDHFHYDVRFILEADRDAPLNITAESNDLQWVKLNELESFTDNISILRMKQKTNDHFTWM